MDHVELTTTALVAGGDAIARDDDKRVVFVTGALPGERVSVEITETRRDFRRGMVVEILEAHPERVTPPCPHVMRGCGGCDLQHASLAGQLEFKRDIVIDALRRTGGQESPDVRHGPALATVGYRTNMRLGVLPDGRLGHRRRGSHELVGIDPCLVAHPMIAAEVAKDRYPKAEEVVLRVGARTGELMVIVDGIPSTSRIHEIVHGVRLQISAASFFQGRADGADALVDAVDDALSGAPDGPRLDAYGGVGLFAATLAIRHGRPFTDWTVVESAKSACADARFNAPGARVVRSDMAAWSPTPMTAVVADPARPGLGRPGVKAVAATDAPVIALVSCDAGSLGRDVRLLGEAGYRLERSTLIDMFPHTSHVEVVSRFVK